MTIGIALKFSGNENSEDRGVILIADRMVSFGEKGIEYPISKIDTLAVNPDRIVSLGIGSGYDFFITEFFF